MADIETGEYSVDIENFNRVVLPASKLAQESLRQTLSALHSDRAQEINIQPPRLPEAHPNSPLIELLKLLLEQGVVDFHAFSQSSGYDFGTADRVFNQLKVLVQKVETDTSSPSDLR